MPRPRQMRSSRICVKCSGRLMVNQNTGNLVEKLDTLNPEQIAAVEAFVEFLRVRSQDLALARAATAASAPAFESVWNNPQDDVYDAI